MFPVVGSVTETCHSGACLRFTDSEAFRELFTRCYQLEKYRGFPLGPGIGCASGSDHCEHGYLVQCDIHRTGLILRYQNCGLFAPLLAPRSSTDIFAVPSLRLRFSGSRVDPAHELSGRSLSRNEKRAEDRKRTRLWRRNSRARDQRSG
jgi:hypothetical protein